MPVSYGLDLRNLEASEAAIALGDNGISTGTVGGSKIGTTSSQKLGLWGATPVVQPKVTGKIPAGSGVTELLEKLASAGIIANESEKTPANDRRNGQSGMYCTSQGVPPNDTFVVVTKKLYLVRFVPPAAMVIKSIAWDILAASSNASDTIDLAIFSVGETKFVQQWHMGAQEGLLNKAGVLSHSAEVTLVQGTVYYLAMLFVAPGTAPTMAAWNYSTK